MVSVKFQGMNAASGIEHVRELISSGLIMDQDFRWEYHREEISDEIKSKYCEFSFKDPKLATFYSLKWPQKK